VISRGAQIEKFFARYLILQDGKGAGTPFVMEPWQSAFTRYFHQLAPPTENQVSAYTSGKSTYAYRGEPMRRVFRFGLLGIPRGNGKSPLASGYGLFEIGARLDGPKFYCLAASKSQADVVHTFSRGFVEGGPLKKHGYHPGANKITLQKNRAFFKSLTTSGLNVHGLNAAGFIGDELHAFVTAQQDETWNGLATTLHKRDNPFALGITTAGFNKATLLGETYDRLVDLPVANIEHSNPCLRIHEDRENGSLFWWYGIPEELHHRWEDPELWRAANPASWLDVDDLKKQLYGGAIDELTFQRLHCNMWTGAKNAWLRTGVWAGLTGESGPFKKGSKIWVGVDIGWNDDSSAVVWVVRRPNGRLALRAKIWTTRTDQVGEKVNVGGTMDLELVERFILELHRDYKIQEIAYDTWNFGRSAQLLRKAGIRERQLVEMPPMHAQTRAAWQAFRQHAEAGELEHDGDPDLAAHAGAVGEEPGINGPRVTKAASGKIDAMAAAVLAVARADAALAKPAPAKVFWMDVESESKGYERLEDPDE
jgi:phage terminase large subunit-like protein